MQEVLVSSRCTEGQKAPACLELCGHLAGGRSVAQRSGRWRLDVDLDLGGVWRRQEGYLGSRREGCLVARSQRSVRAADHSSRACQGKIHQRVLSMTFRKTFNNGNDTVSELAIELWRLEAECVERRTGAPAFPRLSFALIGLQGWMKRRGRPPILT